MPCLISPELQAGGLFLSSCVSLLTFGALGDLEGSSEATHFVLLSPPWARFQHCSNLATGGVSCSVAKMWLSLSLLCVLVAFANARSVPYFPPLSDDLVNHINKLNTTWKVSTGLIWGFFWGDALLTVSMWDLVIELWECHSGGDIDPAGLSSLFQ